METGIDGAVVEKNGVFDDRKSEAGPARLRAATFIDAEKALEDFLQIFGRDAFAGVIEQEMQKIVAGREALYVEGGVRSSVFDSVFDEVAEE